MGWDPAVVPDPQDPATFERSRLRWDELDRPEHAALLAFYRGLAGIRHTNPDVTDPRFGQTTVELGPTDAGHWLRLRRGATEVLVNFSDQEVSVPASDREVLLAYPAGLQADSGPSQRMPAHSVLVSR